ncbi:MAG: hypothetical protein DPW18_09500 [Chloroflexi bacterium]|nr:hypothetical protein [Chloroflexota bacterium]MDL1941759.1 hypothetical protein [Chloroflexi bacterium CFX2]
MRKFSVVLALAFLLQACSLGDVFFPPAATPVPSLTPFITYTPIDTPGPTKTPIPSPSPTIIRIPTQDPNVTPATFAPIPIIVDGNTATAAASSTPFKPGAGFDSVTVSASKIYWGGCKHNEATITAVVNDPEEVTSVIIFTRVKSAEKEDSTPWTSGNVMLDHGNGTFTYRMIGSEVEGHNHYLRSWVHFQLVATNVEGEEVGRTRVFTDMISLFPCLCLDPTTGCPPTVKPANP